MTEENTNGPAGFRFADTESGREAKREWIVENGGKINIEDELQEAGERELAAYEDRCRQTWRQNGGTVEEFESAWPEIRRRHLMDKVTEVGR